MLKALLRYYKAIADKKVIGSVAKWHKKFYPVQGHKREPYSFHP